MYKAVDPKVSFPEMEEGILAFWNSENIFQKSVTQRDGGREFVFYDGPPFATGLPHFGHFVPGTIKDIIPRYQTMKGMKVERRFGWDCHGLPVEYEMEKELHISGRREIEDYGIARFNEACRDIVLRYTKEWRSVITRLGRWVDFDNDYKTMDPDYMESIWWVVRQLWDKGLVFEGYYILPYCPRCSTVLSNHELNLGGYEDVHDPAITVKFKARGVDDTWFLSWTTTPWTLPSNLALTVGPDITYVTVRDGAERYILAKQRLGAYYKSEKDYIVEAEMPGSKLVGMEYEPMFPYFAEEREKGAFRVFAGDYVTTDEGTGIVHTAPGFGEDDYRTLKDSGITVVCPVDGECKFTAEIPEYQGTFVKDADKAIIARLKEEGKLIKRESYLHAYPHCWRCHSPLIYRAITSWFVNVGKVKDRMIAANDTMTWVPDHIKAGRFGKWLENARDWAISRNRYWGNPLPIWRCNECGRLECIGSRAELHQKSGVYASDLHKHFVDEIVYPCSTCGGTMRRVSEVLDCWFESGSMPYGFNHYPFENKERFETHYPANFIAEGLDQTRGWFYTLVVLAASLFDCPPARNVVVNGLVLAEDGKKMSKSERNYSDPSEVMDRFGADALRFFLMNSPVVRADDLRFSDDGVREIVKSVILPLWNAYSFFVTYANIDAARPHAAPEKPLNPLDVWILSEVEKLTGEVTDALDRYELQKACGPLVSFIDLLNNWYIRRSRRRFWRSESDADKKQAYETLYAVLMRICLVSAPIIPFITDEIYRNLRTDAMPASVHLCDYPAHSDSARNRELELKMDVTRRAVTMGRALRAMHSLKVRQPLRAVYLVTVDPEERKVLREMEEIVREELNVKEVIFRENDEDLVEYQAKANFRVLGGQLGKNMNATAARITTLTMREIQSLLEGSTLSLDMDFGTVDLNKDMVVVQRKEKEHLRVLNEGSLTVALDPEITEDLKTEGLIRDLIRWVQNLRKERGFAVTDRVRLVVHGPQPVEEACNQYQDRLMDETLAESFSWEKTQDGATFETEDGICTIAVTKVG